MRKVKKKIVLTLGLFLLFCGGCSAEEPEDDCPAYFEPIVQKLEECRRTGEGLSSALRLEAQTYKGGGKYEDKVYYYYIDDENYIPVDLGDVLQGEEEWDWSTAGVIQDEQKNRTYVLLHDFNMGSSAEPPQERDPQLILLDFDADNPEDYSITTYNTDPRNLFAWDMWVYKVGDYIYFANIPNNTVLAELDPGTKELRYCLDEYAYTKKCAELNIDGFADYHMYSFGAELERDGVYVYGGYISVADDIGLPVGMVATAYKDGRPIAYLTADLRRGDENYIEIKMVD